MVRLEEFDTRSAMRDKAVDMDTWDDNRLRGGGIAHCRGRGYVALDRVNEDTGGLRLRDDVVAAPLAGSYASSAR